MIEGTNKPKKEIVVKYDGEVLPVEVMAQAIVDISEGVRRLTSGRLTKKAIVVLLKDCTGQSATSINRVLEGLEELAALYTRAEKKK